MEFSNTVHLMDVNDAYEYSNNPGNEHPSSFRIQAGKMNAASKVILTIKNHRHEKTRNHYPANGRNCLRKKE